MKNSAKGVPAVALKVLMAVGIALLLCGSAKAQGAGNAQGPANAQGLVTQRNLSLDRAGQVLVILRDEQATAQHAEMARRKAYTARMFRITTTEFQKRTADPPYAAQRDLPDILALGGGAPIQVGNETVGGVGSAGSTLEQDDACAKAGIAKVTDLLQ